MRQVQKEGRLHREQPFVMGYPARDLFDERGEDETVLVQGIIDGYYEDVYKRQVQTVVSAGRAKGWYSIGIAARRSAYAKRCRQGAVADGVRPDL